VVNVIALWNTIYMDAALDQRRAGGHDGESDGPVKQSNDE
jgi:TnpA family transposase